MTFQFKNIIIHKHFFCKDTGGTEYVLLYLYEEVYEILENHVNCLIQLLLNINSLICVLIQFQWLIFWVFYVTEKNGFDVNLKGLIFVRIQISTVVFFSIWKPALCNVHIFADPSLCCLLKISHNVKQKWFKRFKELLQCPFFAGFLFSANEVDREFYRYAYPFQFFPNYFLILKKIIFKRIVESH